MSERRKKRPQSVQDALERRIDIRDVARHARVSVSTVSRVTNRVASVNPQMAARVWRAIEKLNYLPNTQARSLVSGRSRILGLIVSEITNPFFPELIQRFEESAVAAGYELLIASTSYDVGRTAMCLRRMIERNVDGVAVMTFGADRPDVEALTARKVPLAFIDSGPDQPGISMLHVDYQTGIRESVRRLAELRHERIAFISGPLRQQSAKLRQEAFIGAMEELGHRPPKQFLPEGDHTLEGGMEMAGLLLDLPDPPTAIMCSNDMTAIGVLHCLYERDLSVPRDISVVGFDDIQMAQFTLPPLTTIRMSCEEIACAAVRTLRASLEPSEGKLPAPLISTRLIERKTTGRPRSRAWRGAKTGMRTKAEAAPA